MKFAEWREDLLSSLSVYLRSHSFVCRPKDQGFYKQCGSVKYLSISVSYATPRIST
jgi:hypothetical protein